VIAMLLTTPLSLRAERSNLDYHGLLLAGRTIAMTDNNRLWKTSRESHKVFCFRPNLSTKSRFIHRPNRG